MNKSKRLAKTAQILFFLCACVSILALAVIMLYIFKEGLPIMFNSKSGGFFGFVGGSVWDPTATNPSYGILPMILASIFSTLGAIVIGVPIGLLCAIFLSEYCPKRFKTILKSSIQLLAAIPSVVYGFFGLIVLVPLIRNLGGNGKSLLTVIIVLSVMILPTIISMSEDAIRSVPNSYKEASFALGASHSETVFSVTVPAAKNGIFAGVVLGIGRAVGETMAVLLVAGNSVIMPYINSQDYGYPYLLSPIRTLTGNSALEMGYAAGSHQQALFATGVVLLVFIMSLNVLLTAIKRAGERK